MNDAALWIKITRLCEAFGTLPSEGGLLEQQSSHINRLDAVLRARNAVDTEKANRINAGQDLEKA